MAIIIGLTGGIATGKSTVSKMFSNNDIPVIDADKIAHDLMEKDQPVTQKVFEVFGEKYKLPTGHLNRKKLGKYVFNNAEARKKLNDIIHPEVEAIVVKEISRLEANEHDLIVIDVPLLFESGFEKYCDYSIVVFTSKEVQIERLISRDKIELEYALAKIDSQMSVKEKVKQADYVIDNSLSVLETSKQFIDILNYLKKQV